MICSQCCASAALQPSLIGLQLADALSADRNHQTWFHARVSSCSLMISSDGQYLMSMWPLAFRLVT